MTLKLNNQDLKIETHDKLAFGWMLERLLEERPSFAFFKAQLNAESVYVFTRHQTYLAKRWPVLFIMGKGWQQPLVISDRQEWLNCHKGLQEMAISA